MDRWVARYEEGYITDDIEEVTTESELRLTRSWGTTAEALAEYLRAARRGGGDITGSGNGFVQREDVQTIPEFRALGVREIWRRVTFEPSQD